VDACGALPHHARAMWDIFCEVVDNYGDAGMCWRLARMLAGEHGLEVRLWIDTPEALSKLNPRIDAKAPQQFEDGVEIRRWATTSDFVDVRPGEVVIEAFGCKLPEIFVARMAERESKPLWINLEYLSAEGWTLDCHRLASPHPRLPLVKYFFFPGFDARSGGLLREAGLLQAREAFQAAPTAAHWQTLGVPPPRSGELRISLFCYDSPMIAPLLETWAGGAEAIGVLVPEGQALTAVRAFFGAPNAIPGSRFERGALSLQILPFVEQAAYDRLLWACDFNFVRGEDSFIRAQWAARPLVWQAYVQDEQAHLSKLAAFLDLYCADVAPDAAGALRNFMICWNGGSDAGDIGAVWHALRAQDKALKNFAPRWAKRLAAGPELANNLVSFARAHVKSRLF
jgi:uncharacterized repeat protein (TIGR03837 family)